MTEISLNRVLIVDDDEAGRAAMSEWLEREGWQPIAVGNAEDAVDLLESGVDVIVTDLKLPGSDGLQLLRTAHERAPHAPVILISGHGTVDAAVQALKEGAFDFLSKPINLRELSHRVRMALEKRALASQIAELHRKLADRQALENMVGNSAPMRALFEKIRLVAETNATVLITGESGTGKELVARALHNTSPRQEKPFVPVNCAAIPETLVESELFGHEKGAFTGATSSGQGLFRAADGGTLFIDEIGELPLGLQSKLLRALENKTIMPVGSTAELTVDVRLIAATNRDLSQRVEDQEFREDLYYRLKVVELKLPPLRDRGEDIPLLVRYFIDQISKENNRRVQDLTSDALDKLRQYRWPGNVRELRNTLEGIIVLSVKDQIELSDLPDHIRHPARPSSDSGFQPGMTLQELEELAIRKTLAANDGHRADTAEQLGLSVRTLQRKIKEYGL